jgi:hypothetical protein
MSQYREFIFSNGLKSNRANRLINDLLGLVFVNIAINIPDHAPFNKPFSLHFFKSLISESFQNFRQIFLLRIILIKECVELAMS